MKSSCNQNHTNKTKYYSLRQYDTVWLLSDYYLKVLSESALEVNLRQKEEDKELKIN